MSHQADYRNGLPRDEKKADDIAAVTAFLAGAVREGLELHDQEAPAVWASWCCLLGLTTEQANELLDRSIFMRGRI